MKSLITEPSSNCCPPAQAKTPGAPTASSCCSAPESQVATVTSLVGRIDWPLFGAAFIVITIAVFLPQQLQASLRFTAQSLWGIAPWLALSVLLAAYAKASHLDSLIALSFSGHPARSVLIASLVGALSPFCSCGVIPVISGLLGAGVPLPAVMAFWMSSPLMDPEMFILTAATLGLEFAAVKTIAAIGMGLLSGAVAHALVRRGLLTQALRNPGSAETHQATQRTAIQWNVISTPTTRTEFTSVATSNGWFLIRWMTIAFLLESLIVAYLAPETVVGYLGSGPAAIPLAVLIGIPAYLNGYAALPLVSGLIHLGMSPGVALAFLIEGGVTSIPAATAVWALVKPRVFALYLALGVIGAALAGYGYSAAVLWLH